MDKKMTMAAVENTELLAIEGGASPISVSSLLSDVTAKIKVSTTQTNFLDASHNRVFGGGSLSILSAQSNS